MENFKSLKLPKSLEKSLDKLSLTKPTEVQSKTIPNAIDGRDIIVSAPTGTGKTLSFCVPIIVRLLTNHHETALIITPTRELAMQINSVLKSLLENNCELKTSLIIGGMPINAQLKQLKSRPRIIIGTPGRLNDHISRKTLKLENSKFLVLDEMDRMLDMGFSIQIDEIIKHMSKDKQTLMLSATIPNSIINIAKKYLNNYIEVRIDSSEIVNTNIKQEFIHTSKEQKYHDLLDKLHNIDGTAIIFVKTKRNAEDLAKKLSKDGNKAKAIHGDLRQHQRERIIKLFRDNQYNILVGTDVAARGIDVAHIRHVINYNIPTNPEDYVHRVGRTGRAGKEGDAVTFITPEEKKEWSILEHFLDPSKPKPRFNQKRKPRNNRNSRGNKFSKNNNLPQNRRRKTDNKKKSNNSNNKNFRKVKKQSN